MTALAQPPARPWTRALVVFVGRADLWWLRLLRPGFRHCFLVLGSPGGWIAIDPMSNLTEVSVLPLEADCDLAAWYRGQGHVVVEAVPLLPARQPAPWRAYTCVEAVKRILGVDAPFVLTPWQLFRFLSYC
ncbi:MAG: hypothetical protein HYU60_02215 [Magnetospirillum sp.]|nr:hypothetical protein [Magnetospirillum sp.]